MSNLNHYFFTKDLNWRMLIECSNTSIFYQRKILKFNRQKSTKDWPHHMAKLKSFFSRVNEFTNKKFFLFCRAKWWLIEIKWKPQLDTIKFWKLFFGELFLKLMVQTKHFIVVFEFVKIFSSSILLRAQKPYFFIFF